MTQNSKNFEIRIRNLRMIKGLFGCKQYLLNLKDMPLDFSFNFSLKLLAFFILMAIPSKWKVVTIWKHDQDWNSRANNGDFDCLWTWMWTLQVSTHSSNWFWSWVKHVPFLSPQCITIQFILSCIKSGIKNNLDLFSSLHYLSWIC